MSQSPLHHSRLNNCLHGDVLTSISCMNVMNESAVDGGASKVNPNSPNERHRELLMSRTWGEAPQLFLTLSLSLTLHLSPFYVFNKASFNHFDFEHKPLMAPKGRLRQPSWQIPSVRTGKWYNFNRNPVAHIAGAVMEEWWKAASWERISRMREERVL